MPKLREISEKELHIIVKGLNQLKNHSVCMLNGLVDPGAIQHYVNDLDILEVLTKDPYNDLVEE